MIKYITIIILFFIISFNAISKENSNEETYDFWYGFFTENEIKNDYSLWTETQLRFNAEKSQMQQTLFRTGLLKKTSKVNQVGLLYAFVETGEMKEHRFSLQYKNKINSFFKILTAEERFRLESRDRENMSNLSERFRYQLRIEDTLAKRWNWVVYNELFINLNSTTESGNRLLERNRFFLGAKLKIPKDFKLDVGYLNQYIPRKEKNTIQHILVLNLFI